MLWNLAELHKHDHHSVYSSASDFTFPQPPREDVTFRNVETVFACYSLSVRYATICRTEYIFWVLRQDRRNQFTTPPVPSAHS